MNALTRISLCLALALGALHGCATDDKPGGDAGPQVDAGSDAGVMDMGPIDAGQPDSGGADLGPADLGAPDLGPPDIGPGLRLASAGNKFGFCFGNCRFTLTFASPGVTLVVSDYFEMMVAATNTGTLTPAGLARLVAVEADLAARTLQTTYGCPDCADGGASWVEVERAPAAPTEHEYEYFNPPPDTALADALVQDLITALNTCTGTTDITIDPGCTTP